MRHEDESLHYYVDGVDQGAACDGVPPHVYAVVDLYGQCAQVSIIQPDRGRDNTAHMVGALSENSSQPVSLQQANMNSHPNSETTHRYKQSVPLQAWSGPEGSRKLRFPNFMTTVQDGGKIVSLTHWPPLPPENTHRYNGIPYWSCSLL